MSFAGKLFLLVMVGCWSSWTFTCLRAFILGFKCLSVVYVLLVMLGL